MIRFLFLLPMLLVACSSVNPLPSKRLQQARSEFSSQLSHFYGQKIDEMLTALGPPTKIEADGYRFLWQRSEQVKDNISECKITALTDKSLQVILVVAGGNSLYCAKTFAP